jgi:hypothetical protein
MKKTWTISFAIYKQQNTNTSINKNLSCNQNNNVTKHNKIQQSWTKEQSVVFVIRCQMSMWNAKYRHAWINNLNIEEK